MEFPRRPGLPPLARHVLAALAGAVVIAAISYRLGSFRDFQLAEVAVYVAAIGGLTVLIGLSGQISLGHGAFMAIGAYTVAVALGIWHWPLWAALPAGVAITAGAGAVVGVAAARLRGPYLAGATLMLAVALPSLADRYAGVFGGDQGMSVVVTPPAGLGADFPLTRWQAWICAAGALITLVVLANLARSRIGRSWRAIRDDEVSAALAGLNVAMLRVLAFVVSAACGGLAGGMLAITTTLVSPGSFTVSLSIALLAGAVIGGLGSLTGAVWGSLLIVLVPTYIQDVATSHGLSTAVAANIPVAGYGVVLIAVMLAFPEGIQGGLRRLSRRLAPGVARIVPGVARIVPGGARLAAGAKGSARAVPQPRDGAPAGGPESPAVPDSPSGFSPDRPVPAGDHQEEGTP